MLGRVSAVDKVSDNLFISDGQTDPGTDQFWQWFERNERDLFFFYSLFSVLLARSLFLWVSQRGKVENNDTGCGLFLGASFINFMGSARGVAFFVGVLASQAGKGQVGGKLNLRRI